MKKRHKKRKKKKKRWKIKTERTNQQSREVLAKHKMSITLRQSGCSHAFYLCMCLSEWVSCCDIYIGFCAHLFKIFFFAGSQIKCSFQSSECPLPYHLIPFTMFVYRNRLIILHICCSIALNNEYCYTQKLSRFLPPPPPINPIFERFIIPFYGHNDNNRYFLNSCLIFFLSKLKFFLGFQKCCVCYVRKA